MSSDNLDISDNNYDLSNNRERLLWLVEYCKERGIKGISKDVDFIKTANLNSSYLSDLRSGKIKNPSARFGDIVKNIGVNPYWMLTGEGNPFPEKTEALDDFVEISQKYEKMFDLSKKAVNEGRKSDVLLEMLLNHLQFLISEYKSAINDHDPDSS